MLLYIMNQCTTYFRNFKKAKKNKTISVKILRTNIYCVGWVNEITFFKLNKWYQIAQGITLVLQCTDGNTLRI